MGVSDTKALRTIAIVVLVLGLAFTALVAQSGPARAAAAPSWGPTVTITGTGTMNNYTAATLDDGHGSLYIFRFFQAPGGNNLYVYKFSEVGPSGGPVLASGFPVQVNGLANVVDWSYAYPQNIASAAIDHAGNLYVAWTHTATGSSQQDVYVSRSTDGGLSWSLTTQVSSTAANEWDAWPSVVAAPGGTLYVAWVQHMGAWWNITVSTSTTQANSWSTQQNVSELSTANVKVDPPKLAVDSVGRIYLVYDRQAPSRTFVNMTWTDGATWTAPVNLNSGTTASGWDPEIAVDQAGGVHVVWQDGRLAYTGHQEIFYVKSSDRGATWTPQLPISQGLALFAGSYDTKIATEGNNVMVTWDVYGTSTPDNFDQSYVVSTDLGASWTPEVIKPWGFQSFGSYLAVDQNGTFYLATTSYSSNDQIAFSWWHSSPSAPVITSVAAGTASLTVSWNAAPEVDLAAYNVLRSSDGSSYSVVAVVSASATSYADTGLGNGTYWYKVEAVDAFGYVSPDSQPMSGTLGPTVAQLQAEITALQNQLNSANADLSTIQTQLNNLKSQLTAVQGNTTALQNQINNLQNQLNTMQSQQATQTISYANLAFEIIVVVLLVVLLLNQMRKPKNPKLMMAQPGQAGPKGPDDDL